MVHERNIITTVKRLLAFEQKKKDYWPKKNSYAPNFYQLFFITSAANFHHGLKQFNISYTIDLTNKTLVKHSNKLYCFGPKNCIVIVR